MKLYLQISDITKQLRVHRSTVMRWVRNGLIKGAERPKGSKKWLIPVASFQEFINSQKAN